MNSNQLVDIIDTFISVEELNRNLDEFIDSHSECIGTLRKYLLDSIREFIFGESSTNKRLKTIKGIKSSLKGLCCNFGHLVFPSSGLIQFFYRLLSKIFSKNFCFTPYLNINEENEVVSQKSNENEMIYCCVSSLLTILKLLPNGNKSLYIIFTNETIMNINKLNSAIKYKKFPMNGTQNSQSIDIYPSFLQHIKLNSRYINAVESPICVNLPEENDWFIYLMGHITIELLVAQITFYEDSSIRDRFITAWLRVLNSCIATKQLEFVGMILYILNSITFNFKKKISNANILYLIKNNTVEFLYKEDIANKFTSVLPCYIACCLNDNSTMGLFGEFTTWYLNGFSRICSLKDLSYSMQNSNTYISQIELILRFWFKRFTLISTDFFDEYPSKVIFEILNKIPFISENISKIIEIGIMNALIQKNCVCGKISYINIKMFSLLIKLNLLNFFPMNEANFDEMTKNVMQASICGINELYSKKYYEPLIITAHIQMVLSRHFDSVILENIESKLPLSYSISITIELIRVMIENDIGCNYEFGKYILSHLCRTIATNENKISDWGLNQCLLLSELSIRILSKSNVGLESILESLIDLIDGASIFFTMISNCIINLILINCIYSFEIKESLVNKILIKLNNFDISCTLSQIIQIKLVKILSIIILKGSEVENLNIISDLQTMINYIRLDNESCFPFGSSYNSISYFDLFHENNCYKDKLLSFLPTLPICPFCREKNGFIPSKELFICNGCWRIIPTSIDIDDSVIVPEIKNYFSTIDILLHFNKKQVFKMDTIDLLFDSINRIQSYARDRQDQSYFSVLSILLSFSKNKSTDEINNMTTYLQNSIFARNYLNYSQFQLNLLILSRKFVWNNLICYSNLNNNLLSSEMIFPTPLVISKIIAELIDPETHFFTNIEDILRLSLFFGPEIKDFQQTLDKLESIKHAFFGHVFKINELINYISKRKVTSTEFYVTLGIGNKLNNRLYNYKHTDLHLTENSQILFSIASMEIIVQNIMLITTVFTDESFSHFFSTALTALKLAVIGLENNWKLLWHRSSLTEFSKGIIPEKIVRNESTCIFKYNSNVIYKTLSVICSVLMKQNTTLSSISVSPGANKSTSIKLSSFVDSKNKHPNWLISLLGPSFTYLLPNLFYRSFIGYNSNFSNTIFLYLKKHIPSSLSFDKLIIQIPFFLMNIMNDRDIDIETCFNFLKNNIYNNLLHSSTSDDFQLPKALVNTSIASLFWIITSSENIIKFLLNKDDDKFFCKYLDNLTLECLTYSFSEDYIFSKQCDWLSDRINILIYKSGLNTINQPRQKKQRIMNEVEQSIDIPQKIQNYIGKNLMWLLEFYSKSFLIGESSGTWNNAQLQNIFFPISFIISEPPPSNRASMYWYRVFRSLSLLLYFSRKYIKEYATRLLELLMKVTNKSNMHPSCIQCWNIFTSQLIEDFRENININQNIFLHLLLPIIEQLVIIIEPFMLNKSSFLIYLEKFFKLIVSTVLNINKSYFSLIPIVTSVEGNSIRKIILNCYYGDNFMDSCSNNIEHEYCKLVFHHLNIRVDFSLKFFSSHAPYITHEKLVGSIKDAILLSPIDAYWTLFGDGEDEGSNKRLDLLYNKCLNIISNTSNDSLIPFQKSNIEADLKYQVNEKLTSRMNILDTGFEYNRLLPKFYSPRKLNNLEKSTASLKNSISVIIGTIGAIDYNINSYLESETTSLQTYVDVLNHNNIKRIDSMEFQSKNVSMFIKNLDVLTVELIQNHLLAYSHWNVAAFAIQEALKFIGCHNSLPNIEMNAKVWNMFHSEVQDILQPYKSTEYRIIQGTNEHLLDQLKFLSDERTENVYEFYFWCLDLINNEINQISEIEESGRIPISIKNINILFEGCRVVSLGIPSVFNFILPLSIEFILLFCDHLVIRNLKEKLCSLIISGLEYGLSNRLNNFSMIESHKDNKVNSSSFIIHHVTYESIFIVITHLMEIFENIIQCKIPEILPWFNESLLEPFLQELYFNEINKLDNPIRAKNSINQVEEGKTVSPSNVTLSLLAEATKMKNTKTTIELFSDKNCQAEPQYFENEILNYIFKLQHQNRKNEEIKSLESKKKLSNDLKFLSTLSNYPVIKTIANLQFITDLPISILIQAALSCGSYTRALLLFERFLLFRHTKEDFSKRKQRKFSKLRTSLMTQFGLESKYSGNAIDYFGTNGFNNMDFDPLNPLKFYKTCFGAYRELPNIFEEDKKKTINHILYLPFQCYLGIKDTDNLLGIMTIYEQMSTFAQGTVDKQLVESLLREDYYTAATIYERIISNNSEINHLIFRNYLRCLLKAGFPHIVLSTLLNKNKSVSVNLEFENISQQYLKENNFYNQLNYINNNLFISEALEACYQLGNWDFLETIISDNRNNEEQKIQSNSINNIYMDLFIPSNIDTIMQKFNIYRGKLLLHLHLAKSNIAPEDNKFNDSFINTLEKARNLLLTPLSITWNDSHARSSTILEKLHILMDIEFVYYFFRILKKKQVINNSSITELDFVEKQSCDKPEWIRISELFVFRVDNAKINLEKKHSLLSQAKITLEVAGFQLSSFLLLLILERSKISILNVNASQSYINFLNSFEMIGIENQSLDQDFHPFNKNTSAFGVAGSSLMDLHSLNYNVSERVPGLIQLDNSITISYFEKILGRDINSNKICWSTVEKELLEEWEFNCKNKYIISLNQNLLVTYLFKLFQRNQIQVAVHFYEMIVDSRSNNLLDNITFSEINLVYLDWAIRSSMVSPENIINKFQETLELRSNCEKTYFQFANYLDNYFHLMISNSETENHFSTNSSTTCRNNYNLGSIFQCDETIFSCINMYLNCLKCGNSFIYPSLSRVLFLIFNYSNIILKHGVTQPLSKYENVKILPDTFNRLKKEIMELSPFLWYVVLPQLLSRCQHPALGSIIIQPLIAKIIRKLPHQAAWSFVSMLKSNSSERKTTAISILKMSKVITDDGDEEFINEMDFSLIIDEYIRLFDNLTVLAMDSSAGNNIQLQSKDQKVSNRASNKCMSLRSDFQSLYHSMKNLNKSKGLIIPTQLQLGFNYSPISHARCKFFTNYLPRSKKRNSNSDQQFLPCYVKNNQTQNIPRNFITISGIEDMIFVLPSKQKPKKIGLIGSNGETYYYLVKNEKRGDLRKDMRLMELAHLLNQRMSINGRELSLRTFSVVPLSEVAGIIEWVPNVTTLGNIVMGEWKELIGSSKFHRQLLETQDILRQNSMQPDKLYKLYSEEILPKYPPVLHNWFFKKFSTKTSYIWLKSKEKYTKSTAVWSMFGYIVGLGDRHAENILIDTQLGDIIHVDFDCLFGKGFLLEIPEIVPFRLTPNIVIAMGSCGVEGTFTGTSISSMSILRSPFNKSLIMTFLEAFIHDPLIEWMRPGKATQISNLGGSVDPVSFLAAAKGHSHLRTIYRKLNGMVDCFSQNKKVVLAPYGTNNCSQRRPFHERGLGLSVESQVLELISSAKCKRNLSQMYAGWMPQL
ncbi:FRP1 like involved in DNA repair with a FAT domain and a phosphatidylinositol kinase domain at the C-terminus [Cryptosporidium sp. chipmunk genotype I]|uniref:FRP1 like involved in DNA repair with a FAT domain and a phosphatidylinositol kinase domain at the C-terminus n=1 Tax=Cryptosporidium sp. chipmunk genotype I TaxID=1280935 RepID=UPI003519F81D|nr:FRP1 like involved in DNA repair with a FAT domain and a phosphatidylinositol kinase domain at the C-terminus [Cryptosporidium sp. chipmunk genotype I]